MGGMSNTDLRKRGFFAYVISSQELSEGLRAIRLIDRRSFRRGVISGKRAQNQTRWWAENGSGWERIVNADLAGGSTAAAKLRQWDRLKSC
jgi:hypothetical protein